MKKILLAGFSGDYNSSKILLDKIDNEYKLYLENDFQISEEQLKIRLSKENFDEIIIFGEKPIIKSIYIETSAHKGNEEYITNYDYDNLSLNLKVAGYNVVKSISAGNYLCNNIYFYGLKLLQENYKNIKLLFIHIPSIKNISDVKLLAKVFSEYIKIR